MKKKLWFNTPAECFNEALPIGNGRLGATVYGGVNTEKISLNEDTIWSGQPVEAEQRYDIQRDFEPIRELIKERKYHEAYLQTQSLMPNSYTQSYMPAGSLFIERKAPLKNVEGYKRTLDLQNAIFSSGYCSGGEKYETEAFVSHPDQVIVYRFKSTCAQDCSVYMTSGVRFSVEAENCCLILHGKCPTASQGAITPDAVYDDSLESIRFDIKVKVVSDGKVRAAGGALEILRATDTTLYISIASSFNGYDKQPESEGKDYVGICNEYLQKALEKEYDEIKAVHIGDYRKYFDRMYLDLGKEVDLPTNERIKAPQNDPQLSELLFDFGRYLLISSSREGTQPANLQGIWNENVFPAWNANYTLNINTQMNYWGAEPCGLSELHLPLMDMLDELSRRGNNMGLKGWATWHNTDIWRYNQDSTNRPIWGFWQMGGFWTCRHIWEHYEYTNDVEFLKKNIHILKSACDFLFDWLVLDGNGYYTVSPTTSPENHFMFEDKGCGVTEGAVMDLSISRELLTITADAAEVLGEDSKKYREVSSRIKPLAIGSDGRLLEWNEEFSEHQRGHCHMSHLYGIYPAELIKEGTPEFEAAKKSLDYRTDHLGENNAFLGWVNVWRAGLYSVFGDREGFYQCIMDLFHYSICDNMLDAIKPRFQIDGNLGFCGIICSMLATERDGKLELLRALPKEFANGEVRGLRLKGKRSVDIKWSEGKLQSYTISEL